MQNIFRSFFNSCIFFGRILWNISNVFKDICRFFLFRQLLNILRLFLFLFLLDNIVNIRSVPGWSVITIPFIVEYSIYMIMLSGPPLWTPPFVKLLGELYLSYWMWLEKLFVLETINKNPITGCTWYVCVDVRDISSNGGKGGRGVGGIMVILHISGHSWYRDWFAHICRIGESAIENKNTNRCYFLKQKLSQTGNLS